MKPLVSHFIISYNEVEFIGEAIQSAIDQDYGNLEVIVADDGSTDGTQDVILEFAKKYPQRLIPVVGGPNLGITGNCNRALRHCRGKYISCQGGDDVLLPGKISRQVEWLEADQRRVLCGHDVRVIYMGSPDKEYIQGAGKAGRCGVGASKIVREGVISTYVGTSLMWSASANPETGFDNRLPVAADWKHIINIIGTDGIWGGIDGVYAVYRKHSNNITMTALDKITIDVYRTLSILKSEYKCYREEIRYCMVEAIYSMAKMYFRKGLHAKAIRILKRLLFYSKFRHQNVSKYKLIKYTFKNYTKMAFSSNNTLLKRGYPMFKDEMPS
ncbi:MAG TPA: glycosyltransferase family 2 protein [Desulfuromonadaceae bacterium]